MQTRKQYLYHIAALFLILQLSSCQSSQEDYKIEPQKMVEVIGDIHIAEVALQSVSVTLKDSMAEVYYDQVFEIHGVQSDDFYHDVNIIRGNSKELKTYYTKVLESLNQQEKKFLESKKKPKEDTKIKSGK